MTTATHAAMHAVMPSPFLVDFAAEPTGEWRIEHVSAVTGKSLSPAERLDVTEVALPTSPRAVAWTLRGVVSNVRYATRTEAAALLEKQEGLRRPLSTRAALIPVRKSERWWALAQDERRAVMEERSRHIAIGLEYLPDVARRLHHCRDLGEPFDFLTWFEYAPEHADAFERLVGRLRNTEEWAFVDREVDIRLRRD